MSARRLLPGLGAKCRECGAAVVFAVTAASERNRGGKWQPFDPFEDPAGRVALRPVGRSRAVARALAADESHDREVELLGVPHAATCPGKSSTPVPDLPANVVDFATARHARGSQR